MVKEDEIVRPCDQYSNVTVTLRKHITKYAFFLPICVFIFVKKLNKYKSTRKWIIEFYRIFLNRGIKIARVNSILITNSINLVLFTLLTASAQSINREVYTILKKDLRNVIKYK